MKIDPTSLKSSESPGYEADFPSRNRSDLAQFFWAAPMNKESCKNKTGDQDFLLLMELAPPPPPSANTAIMTASWVPSLSLSVFQLSMRQLFPVSEPNQLPGRISYIWSSLYLSLE